MDQERALELLLDRTVRMEAKVDSIESNMATKAELLEVRATMREYTTATVSYKAYVERLLNALTRGQMSLEERVDLMSTHIDEMRQRIENLEKRNPSA